MSDEQIGFPTHLQASIDRIAKKEGFITYSVDKEILSDGASFLGEHFLVTIKGKTEEGDKENNLFIKRRVPGAKIGNTVDLPQAYAAEAYVYNELNNVFTELQDEAGIPKEDRYRTINSYNESNSDALFLENIALKGFGAFPRMHLLSLKDAELSIAELAKFHALSFVTQKKRPEQCDKINAVKIPMFFNDEFASDGQSLVKVALKCLNGTSKERLEKFLLKYSSRRQEVLQTKTPWSCLCHGDYRFTNLLMKLKNGNACDMIIIDFQLLNYGCPLNDFLCFIFNGTDRKFRQKHLNYLKDFYYQTFSNFLEKFDMNSEDVYPRVEFENDYKERLDYGLVSAIFFMPYYLALEGEAPDITEQSIGNIDFKVSNIYADRMQEIVDDFITWGYL